MSKKKNSKGRGGTGESEHRGGGVKGVGSRMAKEGGGIACFFLKEHSSSSRNTLLPRHPYVCVCVRVRVQVKMILTLYVNMYPPPHMTCILLLI
jgi:hypothetical protein